VPAENHVALNVALYGPRARWAMTERGAGALAREPDRLVVGPSTLTWDGTALTVAVDEIAVPLPQRLRGTVRILPAALTGHAETLDAAGRHRWRPIAPVSRAEVAMDRPALTWTGHGYWDANAGDEPLEDGFASWSWSRAPLRRGHHGAAREPVARPLPHALGEAPAAVQDAPSRRSGSRRRRSRLSSQSSRKAQARARPKTIRNSKRISPSQSMRRSLERLGRGQGR
jgi:hypothetical protein